ncbi:MAG TPA: Na+/H+ antiporter subunit B [Thermoanaerobaculia bacterium]|nr:Na+/H+ antiporter subunit B [Thermoanaerobaculia bacterium]
MKSLILQTAARYLIPLLILFSIYTLLRGHNLPGGGFSGGLLAATAFALYVFAWDAAAARTAVYIDPHLLMGTGLLIALCSGLVGMFDGGAFLTGQWGSVGFGEQKTAIGTPVIFDVGVYLLVVGAALMIILSLTEEEEKE